MTVHHASDQGIRSNDIRLSIVKHVIAADDGDILKLHASINAGHDGSRLYSLVETAKLLGVSRMTLWRMVREGRIETVGTAGGGKRISGLAIHKYISGR